MIVTVVRNAAADLDRTCESLQSFAGRFQHLIVDGASTDGTVDMANAWAKQLGSTVISEPDDGPYAAMNTALQRLDPEAFVWFMNAGDTVAGVTAFERVEGCVAEPAAEWCFGAVRIFPDDGQRCYIPHQGRFSTLRYAYARMHICHQSVIVRARHLQRLGGFDVRFPVYADFHLLLRLSLASKPRVLTQVLSHVAGGGISSRNPRRNIHEQAVARRNALQLAGIRMLADQIFTLKSYAVYFVRQGLHKWRS